MKRLILLQHLIIVTPELSYYGSKTRVQSNGSCLKQHKTTHNHEKTINIYIVYKISKNYNISNYPKLEIVSLELLV